MVGGCITPVNLTTSLNYGSFIHVGSFIDWMNLICRTWTVGAVSLLMSDVSLHIAKVATPAPKHHTPPPTQTLNALIPKHRMAAKHSQKQQSPKPDRRALELSPSNNLVGGCVVSTCNTRTWSHSFPGPSLRCSFSFPQDNCMWKTHRPPTRLLGATRSQVGILPCDFLPKP